MKRHRILYIIIFFLITFLVGFDFKCSDEEKDEIKFVVISTGGNFIGGSYSLNGGTTISFAGTDIGNDVYEYRVTLDDVDYLEVSARKTTESHSIEIKIYRDNVKVKSESIEPYEEITTGTYKYLLELDYKYGEEETSS